MTNIVSNSLVALYSVPESAVQASIGSVKALFNPKVDRMYWGEVGQRLYGFMQGARDGVIAGWHLLKNEQLIDEAFKVEARHHQSIPGQMGKLIRVPTRALAAEDQFFKQIAFQQELNAQAYRTAMNRAKKGGGNFEQLLADYKRNPDSSMLSAAKEYADYQTFNNKLTGLGAHIQRATAAHPFAKLVIPFVRTPLNIVHFALQRSLLSPMYKQVRTDLLGRRGEAARDAAAGRILMGSAVSLSAVSLVAQGVMTGSGPSDPKHRALLRMAGVQPYSVKIGDYWYSFDRFEPLGTLLGVAADFAEMSQLLSEDEHEHVAGLVMASVTKNLVNKTWLQGAAGLIRAVTEPERYGAGYLQSLSGTIVPAGISQLTNTYDPYLRQARNLLDGAKQRLGLATTHTALPGMSDVLYARRDRWGEPIKRNEGLGSNLLSAVHVSRVNNDPVNRTLLALKMYPGQLSRKIRGVELDDRQYDDYTRIAGRTAKLSLDKLVRQPKFFELSKASQMNLFKTYIDHASEYARKIMLQQNPDIVQKARAAKLQQQQPGVTLSQEGLE
jgi:hypothetical protein